MSSTLFAAVSLLARLHAFLRRPPAAKGLRTHHAPATSPPASPTLVRSTTGAGHRVSMARAPEGRSRAAPPPLRVLRVVEAGQHAALGGRMVISGRMSDVCAELDRMVAREAALQARA